MSRFWAAGSSSESEQSSGSDSDSSREAPRAGAAGARFGAYDSDSDSEDEVRVAKSSKDRAWDSMHDAIAKIKNAKRNGDWPQVQDEFANVNKIVDKSKMLILQNGLPKFYIKMLMEMEDSVKEAVKDKDAVKKLKAVVGRALNQLKLQVRKHNENYRTQIDDCRANPTAYDEEEQAPKSVTKKTKKDRDDSDSDSDGSESEDSIFGDDDSDSSSSEEEVELTGRNRWLKTTTTTQEKKKRADRPKVDGVKKDYDFSAVARRTQSSWYIEDNMTVEDLDKKVNELVATRGRKNTDTRDILRQLEVLTKVARVHGAKKEIPVLMHLISSMFDYHRSIDDYMHHQQWRTCHRSLTRICKLLNAEPTLILGTLTADEVTNISLQGAGAIIAAAASEEPETFQQGEVVDENVVHVVGSLESFASRLEDEFIKALQQINPHTQEYVGRLSDEASLIELAQSILTYYRRLNDTKACALLSLMIVEREYYKHESHVAAINNAHMFSKTWGQFKFLHPACTGSAVAVTPAAKLETTCHPASWKGKPTTPAMTTDHNGHLQDLCTFIFENGDERTKTRALLCLVYHYALHDQYQKARDLFFISHVQDFVEKVDIKTQILFNRTLVQIGLCAFRQGNFLKAHECLSGICSGRAKELLAQGTSRWMDRSADQEKIDRRRQMPYHMHINSDLLESAHLTSAMILELPQLARGAGVLSTAFSQNTISKQFRRYLHMYSKQVFTGPPENTREHVMAAAKAIIAGEWQKAVDYITGMEAWNLLPSTGADTVREILRQRITEESVRTYLLMNGEHYDSVPLDHLCNIFSMEPSLCRKIICRMIFNKEISAAWDTPDNVLVMYKVDPTSIQTLSLGLAEKLGQLLESNERILDPLVGVYGYKDDWQGGGGGGGGGGGRGQDRRGRGGGRGNRDDDETGARGGKNRSAYYKSGSRPVAIGGGRGRGGRGGSGGRGGGGYRSNTGPVGSAGGAGGGAGNAWANRGGSNRTGRANQ